MDFTEPAALPQTTATAGDSRLKLHTISCRLELYVAADVWAKLSR